MYIREKKNKSGSTSVQIISKATGTYKVLKTIGCAATRQEIKQLRLIAEQQKHALMNQLPLFKTPSDELTDRVFSTLQNANLRTVGPELIFGKIYDYIGFGVIGEPLFRHLVIARLAFPLSKLKTVQYLQRYQGVRVEISKIYRFLDKLNGQLTQQIQQIAFRYTKKILGGKIHVVFYDMTTLYFEASDQDDLRKTGFSKDGKHSNPQIFIGLLVGLGGYPIGYDLFEGNTYEGHTLIPFLERMQKKFTLQKPVVIADSGLLSKSNLVALEEQGYAYILGARIKNEDKATRDQITGGSYETEPFKRIPKEVLAGQNGVKETRKRQLIIHYSPKRAKKDAHNRLKGLERLEKRVKSGKLTKSTINNRGYNKYLTMDGQVNINIDYQKYEADAVWDGLKGYLTNSTLSNQDIVANYKNLWHIEKAFRMSKTDLRIRPIYHRLKRRIQAHICIAFTAYLIYKELERALNQEESTLSLKTASEITRTMYQITYQLPDSKKLKNVLLKMDDQQAELYDVIQKKFRVSQ